MSRFWSLTVAAVVALAAGATPAQAAFQVINFEGGAGTSFTGNSYTQAGFRIGVLHPEDHWETIIGPGGYLRWHDGTANLSPNIIQLTRVGGGAFDLVDMLMPFAGGNPDGMRFTSSSGAVLDFTGNSGASTITFSGAGWQNITSVNIQTISTANNFPQALDNIRVNDG